MIHAYLDKHEAHEDAECQRLQDELLAIYQKDVVDKPPRYAPFLAILRHLKPAISGAGRLLQWWDKLSGPVLSLLGDERGLTAEARETLLDILVYDEEEKDLADAVASSAVLSEKLLQTWLEKANPGFAEEFDARVQFVEDQIRRILLTFGKKRPKVGSSAPDENYTY